MQLLDRFVEVIINPALLLLTTVAILYFLFGLLRFINASRSGAENMSDGKNHMLYGLIGLFVIFGVGGIINTIANTLGVDTPPSGFTPDGTAIPGDY